MDNANKIRGFLRTLLAVSFWLHGSFVSKLLPITAYPSLPFTLRTIYNVALVSFILYYSWLSSRGWFSVIYDLLWIYIWPLWMLFRIIWTSSKGTYKFFKTHSIPSPVRRVRILVPTASTAVQAPSDKKQPSLKEAFATWKENHKPKKIPVSARILKPFLKFTFLWAILLLTIQNRYGAALVCLIVLFGAFRSVYRLWNLLSGTSDWLDKLKSNLAQQMSEKMRQVREWEEAMGTQPIANDVNFLTLFESIFSYISRNKAFLARCTTAAAVIVTIPFYVYISLLFASTYLGMAHVQMIGFGWSDAILDSLYIPFAFTDLPHNFMIRFVAGLQGIAVTVMGWNVFFRNMNLKFDRLAGTAEELRNQFDEESYRQKLALVISKFAADGTPGSAVLQVETPESKEIEKESTSETA